ncbi:RNA polymerase sigma factor [Pelomonas sp. KK5]|uniref:RNA polymerase sigma factor n=1 Tax=Pelomonas sp. KK5 TaxID=1855730 RepID=UPI00097C3343|nr:RNA polymerase sigma factor [Pelomonas sp. KK5]
MSDEAPPRQLLNWVPRLRRYARALAGNPSDADDLVQDTLERAWTRAALWPGVLDMRAWLFGIMHNLHVDGLRRARPGMQELAEDEPAAPAVDRLVLRDLAAALELLPAEQKEVLLMVALEDMSYAEVAQALGIPVGTVMSRLSRGRERLRSLMAGRAGPVHLKVVRQ